MLSKIPLFLKIRQGTEKTYGAKILWPIRILRYKTGVILNGKTERKKRNGSGYQEKQEFITGIYYEYERLMFATARRYIDDRTEQEDVVQEA